jgi:hypothetical protein
MNLIKLAVLAVLIPGASCLHAQTINVNYDSNAPESNFSAPTNESDSTAYSITMTSDATNVYVQLTVASPSNYTGYNFANLYFDTTAVTPTTGSDIGFEVTNSDAFIPGGAGPVSTAGTGLSYTASNGSIDFVLPWSYLETDPNNLGFTEISATNNVLRLNLSQSFGYSVAGGSASYGDTRLGEVTLTTPEPSALSLVLIGGLGTALFARRRLNLI